MLERDTVLDIHLLGPIGAERDGEPVSLGGPRQRAVLARLALTPGRVVTVDRLVEDVWAGDPPATAVNTLQSYVSLLRRALGDPQLLRREGPGYMLAVDRRLLDVARFEDRVTAARTELGSDPGSALAHLEAGLGEWRGPVLADVADEDWARSAATRWNELRMEALEARFDALLALGRHGEAVAELEHIVEENPLREGFARRLMIALYRNGRQADALRVFRETRTLLADELGLDPTPALVELQARILNHDPELAAPASPWTPPVGAAAVAEPVEAPSAEPETSPVPLPGAVVRAAGSAFVGRDRQLAQLHRIWDEITSGGTHAVLLQGEAGAGKSRLGSRFAQEAHGRGAIVMWGRATAEVLVPFEPMVEAVRSIMRTVSPEARRRVASERGLLALLLPELEQIVPEAHLERPDPSVERYLLFETMSDLLRTESAEHPFLLVLDDLQWADVPSLTMIDHVLRHEHPGRLMVVATVRVPHEEPTTGPRPLGRRPRQGRPAHPHHGRRSADGQRRRAAARQRVRRQPRRRSARRHRWQRLLPDRADPAHRGRADRRATRVDPGDDRTPPGSSRSGRRARAQPGGRRRAVGDAADPRCRDGSRRRRAPRRHR